MTDPRSSAEFRASILDAGLLHATSVDGLYHRSGAFEEVIRAVERLASAAGADQAAEVRHFPPVLPRTVFEKTDYLRSFPDLIGSVDTFVGNDRDHAELLRISADDGDWTSALTPSEVMLAPAICHSLYPSLAGTVEQGGRVFEVTGFAFRHEPSLDPARMQAFRMLEFVHVGSADSAIAHRDNWLQRGLDLLGGLGLQVRAEVANDPFFGRVGRMLAANQRSADLKFEIVAAISGATPTAIASANYHQDHFGAPFDIVTADGDVAHSSCFGFGLERIVLALWSQHGLDPKFWPTEVRERLWP